MGELITTHVEGLELLALTDAERKSGRAEALKPWLGERDWTHLMMWGGQCVGAMSVEWGEVGGEVLSPPALEVTGIVFKVRDAGGVELFATYPRRYRYREGEWRAIEGFHQSGEQLEREVLEAVARFLK